MNECHEKIVLLLVILCLTACSAKPYVVTPSNYNETSTRKKIFVVDHGWHTGFVFPTDDIAKKLPLLKQRFSDAPYLEFGWGDQDFYQAREKNPGLTIKAIFWPTDTVVEVMAIPFLPSGFYSDSEFFEGCISFQEYLSLVEFVAKSFAVNESGRIIEIKRGNYGNSQFYKGVGKYYLTNTCNTWTAKGLKSAGMNISPTFKLTSSSIMKYLIKKSELHSTYGRKKTLNNFHLSIDCN